MARWPRLTIFVEDKWSLAGEAESGKSTFAFAWLKSFRPAKPFAYVWNLDGREQEYVKALGEGSVAFPEVSDAYNPIEVLEAIEQDIAKGEFAYVGGIVLDPLTNIYAAVARVGQTKKLEGSKDPTNVEKANTMANTLSAIMRPRLPLLIIYHRHLAAGKNPQDGKRSRDSISETEIERLDKALNAQLQTVCDKGRYGIIIKEAREKNMWTPLTLWDEKDNYFEGMPQRIRNAIYRPGEHWSYDPVKFGTWLALLNKDHHIRSAEALALLQSPDWTVFSTGKEAMAAVRQARESGSVTIPEPIIAPPVTAPPPVEDKEQEPWYDQPVDDLDYGQEGADD